MHLQFLGTGAGMPSKERNTTAITLNLLDENGEVWLFDCGEATQHQILHTSIKPRKITKIFITHMHGDHIFGLPGFLSSRSFLGGEEKLTIFGPKGIKQWLQTTLALSKTHITYEIEYIEIDEGVIYEDEHFIVHALALEHVIPCYGYSVNQKDIAGQLQIERTLALGVPKGPLLGRLKNGLDITLEDGTIITSKEVLGAPRKGKKVTILGDTKYCENAIILSQDADLLVHEATFDKETQHLAAQYGHSTNRDAAKIALNAGAKALILSHISARFVGQQSEQLKQDAIELFPNTWLAKDFATYRFDENSRLKEE